MRIFFKPKVTFVGLMLIAGMLWASHWQWRRHLSKIDYIHVLEERFKQEPGSIVDLLNSDWSQVVHRRIRVSGEYDFKHEVVLRNRMYANFSGVHAITPLKISGTENYILVDRGFLPLDKAKSEQRRKYQTPDFVELIGVVQASNSPSFLGPRDPDAGDGKPWVDAWLRMDMVRMQKQLPYKVMPVYLEIVTANVNVKDPLKHLVDDKSGRDDLMNLSGGTKVQQLDSSSLGEQLPIPVIDTVVSAGRHLGYVYEWAFMAVLTFAICLLIQMRPGKDKAAPK